MNTLHAIFYLFAVICFLTAAMASSRPFRNAFRLPQLGLVALGLLFWVLVTFTETLSQMG